jgi:hypothetical protein
MSELVFLCNMLQLLVTSNVVRISLILSTLMMEALRTSKRSVLTRSIRRHIPENGILRSHRQIVVDFGKL